MIAKIAVSSAIFAIDKAYDYRIPEGMTLQPGMRVAVPFGRSNRQSEGMVLALASGEESGLKDISAALDTEPVLTEKMLRLAAFVRERYFCTFYDALRVILPSGVWFSFKDRYKLAELPENWRELLRRKPGAAALVEKLQALGGEAEHKALKGETEEDITPLLRYLAGKKLLISESDFLKKNPDKTEKTVSLAVSAEEAEAWLAGRGRSAAMQTAVIRFLLTAGAACAKDIRYFTGASAQTLNRLEQLGMISVESREVLRRPEAAPAEKKEFILTAEQETAFSGIAAQMDRETPGVALLYGVTGSGKTAVYIHLIRKCLQAGKSALLLVPEISLTPQLISTMTGCFGDTVAVLHSSLRVGERYDEWKRIKSGAARVIVGARSAVFAPAVRPGLLILDEEQEHTYRSENAPRYHAREVAIYRGAQEKALVLLGSATPSVESMYRAKSGIFSLYTLRDRFNGRPLPKTETVDMKQEVRSGNGSIISSVLKAEIDSNLRSGQKTILLLNRRGGSRMAVCVDCGAVRECPNCSVALTYHLANGRMMCHYCGYSEPYSDVCRDCGGHIKTVGTGTQRAQQELEALYPGRRIIRMDSDTVTAVNTHEKILSDFARSEDAPVLLGTQMVSKGLNFERVTLVGVLDADAMLYSGNFRAAETAFSLISQTVGRSGRGETTGRALIQTYTPENEILQLAAAQDYDRFYETEITLRRVRQCPPFSDLLQVCFSGFPERFTERTAADFRILLLQCRGAESFDVVGLAPAPVAKINNRFRYLLTLRCKNTRPLRQLLAELLREFTKDKNHKGIAVFIDTNIND